MTLLLRGASIAVAVLSFVVAGDLPGNWMYLAGAVGLMLGAAGFVAANIADAITGHSSPWGDRVRDEIRERT